MGIGIIIGIMIASLVWCIITLKLNDEWGDECLKLVLKNNDECFERCKETNEDWKKFCDYLIGKYCTEKEANE